MQSNELMGADVDQGVLVFNEKGIHFDAIKPAIKDMLANSGIRHWIEIKTHKKPEDTMAELQEKTPDNVLVVTFGGDGSVNTVVDALKNRRLFHLFAGGGCATDVPLQLNDILSLREPSQLLKEAVAVDINPLEFSMGDRTKKAVGYVTAGTTPRIQRILESPEHRNHWMRKSNNKAVSLTYEGAVTLNGLRKPENRQPIRIGNTTDHAAERTVMEIMAVNGERMAKVGRFAVSLAEPRFIHSEVPIYPDNRLKTAYTIGKSTLQLVRGTYPASYIEQGDELSFFLPEDENPLLVQYDGELDWLFPGNTMTVRQSADYFTALTTQRQLTAA